MIRFNLDGTEVEAQPGESIWQVARRLGKTLPHLCHRPEPGYEADGNCRACLVEVAGERTLAASCIRQPRPGMVVHTDSPRVEKARKAVFELLLADQPEELPDSRFKHWADKLGVTTSRYSRDEAPAPDLSHPAMAVRLDACITCGLCMRACRDVQVNDVIGLAGRGFGTKVVFDLDDAMGHSSCVGCGECVQACPTGALLPAKPLAVEREVETLCPYCGVGCQVTAKVAGNEIVAVEGRNGQANQNRLCVKGRFGYGYVHNPQRLTKPLIRKPGVAKSLDGNPRDQFREASWEEALEAAAGGLKAIRDRFGGQALAGFGSAKGSNEEAYLFQKLVRTGFGTNNVDHCTRLCHASSVAALMETIGSGAVTAPVSECLNSDVIFVIGANPSVNHPVAASFMKNAARAGAKLIVADPRGQALSRYASHMLRFRPGSDVSLLNALMNVIVEEGLHDPAYVSAFTEGFDVFAAHIAQFTPERMAPICGIDAETLREVARAIATAKGAMIFWGMGVSQHVHGTDNARCLISLALLCGHVGKKGAGLHPLRGQNNVQGASDAGLIPMVYPGYQRVDNPDVRARFESLWGQSLDPKPGLTVVEICDAALKGDIKGLYVMGENPAMSDPDLDHVRAALAALDHLVVQDIFLTETAAFADVVLPAGAFFEKTGSFTNTDRRVQMARRVLAPPGEARDDWAIIQDIACRLGLNWHYAGPHEVFEEMRWAMPGFEGISWQRLEREGAVTYPCAAEDRPGEEVLFGDGFPTASKRGKLVPASLLPPDEAPDGDFPMVLITGRVLEHWHTGSMTRRSSVLDALEPEATVQLSPDDARRLGVGPGDSVTVATRRGSITCAARIDRNIAEGTLFLPFCFAEAPANRLTNPALDPFGKIPEFKYAAARVSLPGETRPSRGAFRSSRSEAQAT
ncbi:formate dehydrogenase subunit alpha [Telmatospirillum sp. J64-1]|uniref:formate dehydrogenase subunit alpha n=1 Tax=Telmatospirillum sp. J64-1 TaxID=2502183 RepID=UPI001C8F74F6|nr:formate dehydrogenase subunit alpha [Telmatospirillum sp. J64-1]